MKPESGTDWGVTYPAAQNPYPGHPSNYSSYPPVQPARRRGRRARLIGAVVLAIGVALLATGIVLLVAKGLSKVGSFQRVAVKDATGTVTFKHAGGYIAYYESDSITDSTEEFPLIPVRLTNEATQQSETLSTLYGNQSNGKVKKLTYKSGGHNGVAMYQFHIDQPGTYKVELGDSSAAPDDEVAFGTSIAKTVVAGVLLVVFGVFMLLGGVVTLIVGVVLGSANRTSWPTYPAQPAGWPTASGPSWPAGGQPVQPWPPAGGQPGQSWPPPGQHEGQE